MREIYFEDFRSFIKQQRKELLAQEPENHSIEWFLLRYLRRMEKCTVPPAVPGQVENAIRGFIRFYVDNIEESSPLGERCMKIYNEYRKTLRENQEKSKG